MWVITEAVIIDLVGQYLWPLIRISAFFMAAPIFGTRMVSARVRVVLSLVITIIVAPLLPDLPEFTGLNLQTIIVVIQEVIIGAAFGFIFQVVFHVFILAGQYIAMKMGLGFASMNDPANGVSVTIVSQFYMLVTTMLFLSINGHIMLVQILVDSFTSMPVGSFFAVTDFYQVAELGNWMFGSALIITLPVLTALLVVNIAFGVMSRSAPQMNIFAVGFPITLIFGLVIMWIGFGALLPTFYVVIDQGVDFILRLTQ